MTALQEQAIDLIRTLPDERILWLLQELKKPATTTAISDSLLALEELNALSRPLDVDIDEKAELAAAREEKYARFS